MRHRGQVGTVGFHHEGVGRNRSDNIPDKRRIFECDDACEGNKVSACEDFPRLIRRVAKAMEHTAKAAGVVF